jgi:hypothetical protein
MFILTISAHFGKRMMVRYIAFILISGLSSIFFWYYMMVFCAIYKVSKINWAWSLLQSLVMDWCVFELVKPVGFVVVRLVCKRFKGLELVSFYIGV